MLLLLSHSVASTVTYTASLAWKALTTLAVVVKTTTARTSKLTWTIRRMTNSAAFLPGVKVAPSIPTAVAAVMMLMQLRLLYVRMTIPLALIYWRKTLHMICW
jgi:hypothetical protein